MRTLLNINASGRTGRSITRRLTRRFADAWRASGPDARVVERDVGLAPPPAVDERWIAAAFADPDERAGAMHDALALSETLIAEIESADALLIGTPMYNFGMPAQLKAYFDQVVRVGRTFDYDPSRAEPYAPLLRDKPVVIAVSAGDGALHPGGPLEAMNHLEPHLRTVLGFIGLESLAFIRVGYEEFADQRLRDSIAAAEVEVDRVAAELQGCVDLG